MRHSRKLVLAALALVVVLGAGCGSSNKGKIEGRWKLVSLPNQSKPPEDRKVYTYFEFKPDGAFEVGATSDPDPGEKDSKPEDRSIVLAKAKYRLQGGDYVEIYDLPKELQDKGGGVFGGKDKVRIKIKISGDNMDLTDAEGTAKLVRVK
jgi:hypothetical protein